TSDQIGSVARSTSLGQDTVSDWALRSVSRLGRRRFRVLKVTTIGEDQRVRFSGWIPRRISRQFSWVSVSERRSPITVGLYALLSISHSSTSVVSQRFV